MRIAGVELEVDPRIVGCGGDHPSLGEGQWFVVNRQALQSHVTAADKVDCSSAIQADHCHADGDDIQVVRTLERPVDLLSVRRRTTVDSGGNNDTRLPGREGIRNDPPELDQ